MISHLEQQGPEGTQLFERTKAALLSRKQKEKRPYFCGKRRKTGTEKKKERDKCPKSV